MLHKVELSYNVGPSVVEYSVTGDVILYGDILVIEVTPDYKISAPVRSIVSLKIDGKMLDRSFPKNIEALLDSIPYPSYNGKPTNKVHHSCTVRFFRGCEECCQIFSSVMLTAGENALTLMDYRFVNNSFRYDEILELSIDGEIVEFEDELTYEKMRSVLNNLK